MNIKEIWEKRGDVKDYSLSPVVTIEPEMYYYLSAILLLILTAGIKINFFVSGILAFITLWLFEKSYNKGRARVL